jgi:hypothetical protein
MWRIERQIRNARGFHPLPRDIEKINFPEMRAARAYR